MRPAHLPRRRCSPRPPHFFPESLPFGLDQPHPLTCATLPQILGHEFSGTVVEVGEGVPDGVDLRMGALVEPMAVGWHAVSRSGVRAGGTALVAGAGPVGIGTWFAIEVRGAEKVLVLSEPSADRGALMVAGEETISSWTSSAGCHGRVTSEASAVGCTAPAAAEPSSRPASSWGRACSTVEAAAVIRSSRKPRPACRVRHQAMRYHLPSAVSSPAGSTSRSLSCPAAST